jgi:hypothetical protein
VSVLRHLGHEKLTLRKAHGTTREFDGHVQPELIVVAGVAIPFQEEDLVIRQLRNGRFIGSRQRPSMPGSVDSHLITN